MTRILKSSADIENWFKEIVEKEKQFLLTEVDEISAGAADEFRNVIATTPSSIVPGKPDRIYTGEMYESVDNTSVAAHGKNRWRSRIGWTSHRQDYFLTQEHGGSAPNLRVGRRYISPMHALHAAWIYINDQVKAIPGVK